MLIVALPLQLAHKFHHTKLNIREDLNVPVGIRFQRKLPYKTVFIRADKVFSVRVKPVLARLKICITHTVGAFPFVGFITDRLRRGAEHGVAVLYVGIKTASVGRQMEKAVVIYTPYLRRFIESDAAARLRNHRVKCSVS